MKKGDTLWGQVLKFSVLPYFKGIVNMNSLSATSQFLGDILKVFIILSFEALAKLFKICSPSLDAGLDTHLTQGVSRAI
jgi:hypothetical protein